MRSDDCFEASLLLLLLLGAGRAASAAPSHPYALSPRSHGFDDMGSLASDLCQQLSGPLYDQTYTPLLELADGWASQGRGAGDGATRAPRGSNFAAHARTQAQRIVEALSVWREEQSAQRARRQGQGGQQQLGFFYRTS